MELSAAKRALLEKWLQGQTRAETTNIPRRPPNSPIPLSFPQQRQLFLELLEERDTAVNNLSIFITKIKGKVDLVALEESTNQIIARHDILRTRFSFGQGMPASEVLTALKITFSTVDLQGINAIKQLAEAGRHAEKEVLQPFNLTQAPLIRLMLYILSKEKYLLLLVVHHTIADGSSWAYFWGNITFYQAIIGNKSPLPRNCPYSMPTLRIGKPVVSVARRSKHPWLIGKSNWPVNCLF